MEPYKYESYERFVTHLEDQEKRYKGNYFDHLENEVIEDEKVIMGHLEFANKLALEIEDLKDKKYVFDQSNKLFSIDNLNVS